MPKIDKILASIGAGLEEYKGADLKVRSPINGKEIASLATCSRDEIDKKIENSVQAFHDWRLTPAPVRGELIRLLGEELRIHKHYLGQLVSIECGKIIGEGLAEVQEMIDICDFAVGLSRQVGGLTLPSERFNHSMQENWLPLGTVGVISAFNFPVAVWAWNFALAIVCGNSVIWKPSDKTPITAIVCQKIFENAVKKFSHKTPKNLSQIIIGFAGAGEQLTNDNRIALLSATGSSRMGAMVAPIVAKRFGKSLLELGGNNAVIITKSADMSIALPSIVFGSVGTAGQRCTTTRRAFIHKDIYEETFEKIKNAYKNLGSKIGDPLNKNTLIGPLIDEESYENMKKSLKDAKDQGGEVFGGTRFQIDGAENGFYVKPALVKIEKQTSIVKKETFAPILYVMPYENLEDAIAMQNDVAQGLSSAIFTNDLREAETFKINSDCGIANVNIGTSGAEIGGAFGGEKETGGGRESGSDAWKAYMRRQTSTTYYGDSAPELAQGLSFDIE